MKLNRKTLNNQRNKKIFKIIRESINKYLLIIQEYVIKNYIICMNKKNILLTFKFVENVINFVFRKIDSSADLLKNC